MLVPFLAAATLALFILASFAPDARLWGVNHLAFYPLPVRVLALALIASSFVPRVRVAVAAIASRIARLFSRRPQGSALLAAVACFALFLVLSAATLLFGDGTYVFNIVDTAARASAGEFPQYLRRLHPAFPGTNLLFTVAARTLELDALVVIRVMVSFTGALLAFAFFRWLFRPQPPPAATDRLMGLTAATSGAVMLFFGYVEVYAPFTAAAVLYVVSGWKVLRHGGALWKAAALAAVASLLHVLGFVLLPSLAFLAAWVAGGRGASPRLVAISRWAAAALLPLPWVLRAMPRIEHSVRPLLGGDTAVISARHMVDVANELLLVCPALVIIGGTVLGALLRPGARRGGGEARSAPAPDSTEGVFVLLLFVPAFVFLLAFRSDIGVARDWDLFAPAGAAAMALLWYGLRRAPARAGALITSGAAVPLIVLSTTMTAAWIGINASSERSVARYEMIMTRGAIDTAYAYEQLASYHHARGDLRGEIGALESMVAVSGNPRYRFWLAARYYAVGEAEKAIAETRRYLSARPENREARYFLVGVLYHAGRTDDLLAECENGIRLDPNDPYYHFFRGRGLAQAGAAAEAVRALLEARRLNPPAPMKNEIDQLLAALGAPD